MLNDRNIATTSADAASDDDGETEQFRDIHPLAPPPAPPSRVRRRETWETSSSVSSVTTPSSSEGFTTMSREFNALVLAGSTVANSGHDTGTDEANDETLNSLLARIREDDDDVAEDTNPLAIVPDNSGRVLEVERSERSIGGDRTVTVERVKKEEVEAKISAWQNAKAAKINNRLKREEAVISGLESEQVQKATSWMKKVERKLEEKRAKALEKMQNDVAKARRKAEERRASAEAKRGTKIARILEIANLMRAVGRAPVKRSFF